MWFRPSWQCSVSEWETCAGPGTDPLGPLTSPVVSVTRARGRYTSVEKNLPLAASSGFFFFFNPAQGRPLGGMKTHLGQVRVGPDKHHLENVPSAVGSM